jgi:hypothetical protein
MAARQQQVGTWNSPATTWSRLTLRQRGRDLLKPNAEGHAEFSAECGSQGESQS